MDKLNRSLACSVFSALSVILMCLVCTHEVNELCLRANTFYVWEQIHFEIELKQHVTCACNVSKQLSKLQFEDSTCVHNLYLAFSYFNTKCLSFCNLLHSNNTQPEGTRSVNIDPCYIYSHKIFQWQKSTELNYEPVSYRAINRHFDECIAARKWDASGESAYILISQCIYSKCLDGSGQTEWN